MLLQLCDNCAEAIIDDNVRKELLILRHWNMERFVVWPQELLRKRMPFLFQLKIGQNVLNVPIILLFKAKKF